MSYLDDKLKTVFDGMVVYKDVNSNHYFRDMNIPSFLRDWLLMKFSDSNGSYDMEVVEDFVAKHMPGKDKFKAIKNALVNENDRVLILTRISADIDLSSGEMNFSLPNYGLTPKETIIEPNVWNRHKDELLKAQDSWGLVELGYQYRDENSRSKKKGLVQLKNYTDFRPYEIDLEYYKDARNEFSINEWIDVLIGAIDYDETGFDSKEEKIAMLSRLLPFVEKRLNLIELAPKGTGKSYLFGSISKYGTLTDGGRISRAKMFYDIGRGKPGFILGHDFVAIDEVKLVTFSDVNEMRSVLQGYMERGSFNVGGYEGTSDAGIVFLGNIDVDNMDVYENMFGELPSLFKETALMDRIHGFIKGWDIPRLNDDMIISGWALNSEYFCSILHLLRDDPSYRYIVDKLVEVPPKADTRDTEAVKRLATAFLKLLFPNVRNPEDVNITEFKNYCLDPARNMRNIIKKQMGILDKEFLGKEVPFYNVKRRYYD